MNKAAFPAGVGAPVQYGPRVRAAAVYLNNYQFLPYKRTCELLDDLFGCPISQGTLANIIADCHHRLEDPVALIKQQIAQAPVAHFDENRLTGGKHPVVAAYLVDDQRHLLPHPSQAAAAKPLMPSTSCLTSPAAPCTTSGNPTTATYACRRCATLTICAS